jgi:Xaa-Pro aminopeptidase
MERSVDSERLKRNISALRMSKLDAFLCSLPSQVLLLTGYWPVMGVSVALLTVEGEVHILLPEDEEEIAEHSSGATRTVFHRAGLHAISDLERELSGPLIRLLTKLKLHSSRIGVEVNPCMQPVSYAAMSLYLSGLHESLQVTFPKLQLIPADRELKQLKGSKTQHELEKIRVAARIAGAAFEDGCGHIEAGKREAEIASSFQSAFDRTPLAASAQRSYGFFFCMSGSNAARASAAYARTRQRVVEERDTVMVHCNSCADGFWTDVTRTYVAGRPDSKQEDMQAAIMEARRAALDAITTGALARDIDSAARSVLKRRNFGKEFKHATGHGVGFAAANPNAIPRIHPESADVLGEGMTFNIEPAIYFDGYGGMRHCDMVGVRRTGAEVFTNF